MELSLFSTSDATIFFSSRDDLPVPASEVKFDSSPSVQRYVWNISDAHRARFQPATPERWSGDVVPFSFADSEVVEAVFREITPGHLNSIKNFRAGSISRRKPGRNAISGRKPGKTTFPGHNPGRHPGRKSFPEIFRDISGPDFEAILEIKSEGLLNQDCEQPASPTVLPHSDKHQSIKIQKKIANLISRSIRENFRDGILPGNDKTHKTCRINQNFKFQNKISTKIPSDLSQRVEQRHKLEFENVLYEQYFQFSKTQWQTVKKAR
jgi:hypothetical protein